MDLLSGILQHAPQGWSHHSYSNGHFVRIALNNTSSEYQEIENNFLQEYCTSYVTVRSIERIQHPLAYGKFYNRKEQLTVLHSQAPKENRKFLSITDPNKVDIVIEFNCDHRRGGFNHESQVIGTGHSPTGYVLVVKMLGDNFDKHGSTHRYPEYLIQYQHSTSRSRDMDVFSERVKRYPF